MRTRAPGRCRRFPRRRRGGSSAACPTAGRCCRHPAGTPRARFPQRLAARWAWPPWRCRACRTPPPCHPTSGAPAEAWAERTGGSARHRKGRRAHGPHWPHPATARLRATRAPRARAHALACPPHRPEHHLAARVQAGDDAKHGPQVGWDGVVRQGNLADCRTRGVPQSRRRGGCRRRLAISGMQGCRRRQAHIVNNAGHSTTSTYDASLRCAL